MLSVWDNRVNDLMHSGMEELEDGEEKWTYKHLIESAAIFRIRPDWFDRMNDTRGHGTLLARSKEELGHINDYEYIEDEEKRGEWLDRLRVFSQKLRLAGTNEEQFTTVLNGKEYVYVKDLGGNTCSPVKLFRRNNPNKPDERLTQGAAVSTSVFSLVIATWDSTKEALKDD